MNNKDLKEIFLACSLILVSMLAFGYVKMAEIGIVLASGALGFIMLRGNMVSVVLGVALTFAADFAADMSFNFLNGLIVCMCGFSLNFALRAKWKLLSSMTAGVAGVLVAFALSFCMAELFGIDGMKLSDARTFFAEVSETVDLAAEQAGFSEIYSTADISIIKNMVSMIMVPVSFITMAVLISYYALCVLKKMLKSAKSELAVGIADFSHIKADKLCALMWVLSAALFVGISMSNQVIGAAAFCMLYILSAFYYICGISVMWYFMKRQIGAKKVLWFAFLIFGALFMALTVFIFGMIDSFADIRKLGKENS